MLLHSFLILTPLSASGAPSLREEPLWREKPWEVSLDWSLKFHSSRRCRGLPDFMSYGYENSKTNHEPVSVRDGNCLRSCVCDKSLQHRELYYK